MSSATTTTRGFKAPCIHCGEGGVVMNLADLNELHCPSCDADFTLDDVREVVASWSAVIAWCDSAPVLPE